MPNFISEDQIEQAMVRRVAENIDESNQLIAILTSIIKKTIEGMK